jgi:hypothetical protein
MHIGKKNPSRLYSIEGTRLAESRCERDLGIIVTSNLKWNEQCSGLAISIFSISVDIRYLEVNIDISTIFIGFL